MESAAITACEEDLELQGTSSWIQIGDGALLGQIQRLNTQEAISTHRLNLHFSAEI